MICDQVEELTPETAAAMLDALDDRQRAYSAYNASALSDSVARWGWQTWLTRVVLTPQSTVIDGQHTLRFIAAQGAGTVWPTRVVRNVPARMVFVIHDYSVAFGDSQRTRPHPPSPPHPNLEKV